jgi:RNA polymerase sigma factor (sigma-70 family)
MSERPFVEVLTAARAGQPWACARLYEGLKRPVVAYLRLQRAADPDDVASEVFLQVFRDLGNFEGDEAAFRAWVFTIARRRLMDAWRAASRRPALTAWSPGLDPVGGDVEEDVFRNLGDERIAVMLAGLTPEQRDVVLLRIVADLPLEQVARTMGRSVNATKALQRRAVRALRRSSSEPPVPPEAQRAIEGSR